MGSITAKTQNAQSAKNKRVGMDQTLNHITPWLRELRNICMFLYLRPREQQGRRDGKITRASLGRAGVRQCLLDAAGPLQS